MNIIIDKDGNLYVNDFENNDERLAACIVNPADGNAIVYNATKGIWEAGEVSGGGGSGGGSYVVNVSDELVCDKKASEIAEALENGVVVMKQAVEGFAEISIVINYIYSESDGYIFGVLSNGNNMQNEYKAATGNDYPALDTGEN